MNGQQPAGYFQRVTQETPTRLWINNATREEAEAALALGAVGATTNPTYPARLLRDAPESVQGLIDQALKRSGDDNWIADYVYRQSIAELQSVFMPLYEQSGGRLGHVAVQGDPRVNDDPQALIEGALSYFEMGRNIIVKVPATPAGAEAVTALVARGFPLIATLGFSVDQAVYMAETYEAAVRSSQASPVFYTTFIAGILDEYLARVSKASGNDGPAEWIRKAGCEATRAAVAVFEERRYRTILMGGGARDTTHFTELVGGALAITIGWSMARELAERDGAVVPRIHDRLPGEMVSALEERLPDFRRAYRLGSLRPDQFCDFAPVADFQKTFLKGMDTLLQAIAGRRSAVNKPREKGA